MKCKYTHYRPTYCLGLRGADLAVLDSDPASCEFELSREITGEPLNSRSRILAPNWREIMGVDCIYIPRLLHGPDCFTVPTCCTYTDLGSRGYFGVYRRSCFSGFFFKILKMCQILQPCTSSLDRSQ